MFSLTSALVSALISSSLAAVLFLALYLRHRRSSLGFWAASWAAQALLAALMLFQAAGGTMAVRQLALLGLLLASVWLLARAAFEFTGHKFSLTFLVGSFLVVALEAATGTTGWPTHLWLFLMQAAAAATLWRNAPADGRLAKMASLVLILWALVPLSSPIYDQLSWLSGWGGLISALLGLGSVLGLLVLFFESEAFESRDAQADQAKTSATLKAILDTTPVAITYIAGRRVKWANPAAEEMLGYTLEELEGSSTECFHVSREEWQRAGDELYSQLSRQGKGSVEARYLHKDGREIICHVQGGPLIRGDFSGGFIFTLMDITARKRAEQQLARQQERLEEIVAHRTEQLEKANRELRHENTERKNAQEELLREKERFHSLAEQAPLSISLLGPDGYYKYLNPKFVETFGYNLSDIKRGRDWFEKAYPDPKLRREALTAWQDDLKTYGVGEARPQTYAVRCKDGGLKTVDFRPVAMASGDNLVFYVDVTGQKKLEAQLAHAQKMEAVGTLSGGIAHEFNNILMSMRGYLQLLFLEADLPEKAKERIANVVRSTERAAELIQKMLTFSRLDSDERTLVDVNAAVQTVYGLLRESLNHEIKIHLDLVSEPPKILANYSQLEQILLNLAFNARDAIAGPGEITIRTQARTLDEHFAFSQPWTPPGQYLAVIIEDSGQGMTPDVAGKAFDPFFTTKGPDQGTGLGLAVAYALVHNLDGGIQVESESGKGSVFTIYLPVPSKEDLERTPKGVVKGFKY